MGGILYTPAGDSLGQRAGSILGVQGTIDHAGVVLYTSLFAVVLPTCAEAIPYRRFIFSCRRRANRVERVSLPA
ncbi:MAG TPA: hypothetical protein VH253_20090 [Phycisphaerae bacterium]|nr:hypothetical protein [Phycisphaerae bacterium]